MRATKQEEEEDGREAFLKGAEGSRLNKKKLRRQAQPPHHPAVVEPGSEEEENKVVRARETRKDLFIDSCNRFLCELVTLVPPNLNRTGEQELCSM